MDTASSNVGSRGTRRQAEAGLAYGGYYQTWEAEPDDELTRVGPRTPCGEYLRRFWHPVALAKDLKDLPLALRILGEDLVLFRDGGGRVGLVHRHCPHRLASLEYGICEERGIRCCYHGLLFDIDGTILETPCDPPDSEPARRLRENLRLGAYPTHEFKGLIFAYLGPPDEKPVFPVYDSFDIEGMDMVPYKAPFKCNWLQVLDAILDPVHTSFLHSSVSREQFSEGLGELGELALHERGSAFLGANTRRVGDNIWVRINELILPNFTQSGAAFATDGTASRYFGRSAFTRWVVPHDDISTTAFAWANFGERGDPPAYNDEAGPQLIEQGELFERSYEERQRFPADLEATEGMGPITCHKKEHLLTCDQGVARYRHRLRRALRDLQAGTAPEQPRAAAGGIVPTYGCDTVLRLPNPPGHDERAFLRAAQERIMALKFAAEDLPGVERDRVIDQGLKALETAGLD